MPQLFSVPRLLARHTVTKTAVTTTVNIGFHGSILFAMVPPGLGVLDGIGPIGDRIGRAR